MGTKRHLTEVVCGAIVDCGGAGPVMDLFAGVGAVSAGLSDHRPIIANDLLTFTNCFTRALFTSERCHPNADALIEEVRRRYLIAKRRLTALRRDDLQVEAAALNSTDWTLLRDYVGSLPHAGASRAVALSAKRAERSSGILHFQLAQLYFSSAYFSLHQAIQIDCIKYAIQETLGDDDIALTAWLGAVSDSINAPGHTAQFLQARSAKSAQRVASYWRRDVWLRFEKRLRSFTPQGSRRWRIRNKVTNLEARAALLEVPQYETVYADPPYTKDHYSRYYHLYETLYRYDYPVSDGLGRYRGQRFTSDFSRKSTVADAFDEMVRRVSERKASLVLSYPSNGLLHQTDVSIDDMLADYFKRTTTITIPTMHSTMGARSGKSKKGALERIYVCTF